MLKTLRIAIHRDLLLAMRRPADVLTAVAFFVIVVTLFPLGVGPEPQLLRTIAPGVIWVAALLASMLSLPRMFGSDHADGTLEQMLLGAAPLGGIVIAKVVAHWLVSGLPLVLLSPVLALQYNVDNVSLATLPLTLLFGTPVLGFIGAIGAALTLGLRSAGVLLSLLVLPLYVPGTDPRCGCSGHGLGRHERPGSLSAPGCTARLVRSLRTVGRGGGFTRFGGVAGNFLRTTTYR